MRSLEETKREKDKFNQEVADLKEEFSKAQKGRQDAERQLELANKAVIDATEKATDALRQANEARAASGASAAGGGAGGPPADAGGAAGFEASGGSVHRPPPLGTKLTIAPNILAATRERDEAELRAREAELRSRETFHQGARRKLTSFASSFSPGPAGGYVPPRVAPLRGAPAPIPTSGPPPVSGGLAAGAPAGAGGGAGPMPAPVGPNLEFANALATGMTSALKSAMSDGYRGMPDPKLTLELFSGKDPTKYPAWRAKVLDIIRQKALVVEYRFEYLRAQTTGDARVYLDALASQENSYELALEDLDKRYGQRDFQVQCHYAKLKHFGRLPEKPSSAQIRALFTFIRDTFNAFVTYEATIDPTLYLADATSKLNDSLGREWAKKVVRGEATGRHQTIDSYLQFLQDEMETADIAQRANLLLRAASVGFENLGKTQNQPKADAKGGQSSAAALPAVPDGDGDKKKKKKKKKKGKGDDDKKSNENKEKKDVRPKVDCVLCGKHKTAQPSYCSLWKKADLAQRWQWVRDHNLCSACSGQHELANCDRKQTCGIDGCSHTHRRDLHQSRQGSKGAAAAAATEDGASGSK